MIIGEALKEIRRRICEFGKDTRASVTVDFIVSIPILLAVLVLTSEYGRILQMRSSLENAVSDATRYLARVPLVEPAKTSFPPEAIQIAERLITSRINTRYIAISTPVVSTANGFTTVELGAAAAVVTPALAVLNIGGVDMEINGENVRDIEGVVVTTSDVARHFGQ